MCNGHFYHEAFDSTEKSIIKLKMILETIYVPRCKDEFFLLPERFSLSIFGLKMRGYAQKSSV